MIPYYVINCEKHGHSTRANINLCAECEAEIVPTELKCSDSVVEEVVAKLRSRSQVGVKKYGTTLDGNNSSVYDWLNHLQEELMDAVNYIEKLKQVLYIPLTLKGTPLDGK